MSDREKLELWLSGLHEHEKDEILLDCLDHMINVNQDVFIPEGDIAPHWGFYTKIHRLDRKNSVEWED